MPLSTDVLYQYYSGLDCAFMKPTMYMETHYTWQSVYNATSKEYIRLRKSGFDEQISGVLTKMMKHRVQNPTNIFYVHS